MGWSGGFAEWIEGDTAYLSIAFSWRLPDAYQRAAWYHAQGYRVRAGGPGLFVRRNYLSEVAEIGGSEVDALIHHNPQATIASRGCPVGCYFCIVPKMEGLQFTLLPDFTPRPILCDNNLSALPVKYQEFIIEKYQAFSVTLTDANSGFEPLTFDESTYHRWKAILRGPWRFAFDETKEEPQVRRMMTILRDESPRRKQVYVLIGNEPVAACHERAQKIIEWGGEPYLQPLIPLNALGRDDLKVAFDWTWQKLKDMQRYYNRHLWRYFPLTDYVNRKGQQPIFVGMRMDARNLRLSLEKVKGIAAAMQAEQLDRKPP